VLSAGLVAAALYLGGGLGLLPGEPPPAPPPAPEHDTRTEPAPPKPPTAPPASSLFAIALGAAMLAAHSRRSDAQHDVPSPGAALGLRPPPDMRLVLVPGHGNPHASVVFGEMVRLLGIDPANVRYFDYRWISGLEDHRFAAKVVPVEPASMSLNSFLAGVAAEGHPVYVVGFSKGGAVLADLVARWDRGHPGPTGAIVGTALLDPPIAAGVRGHLQSLGRMWSGLPDDGGYDPYHCTFLRIVCRDTRIDLGRPSGIEVLVIQNPKAGITNVGVAPRGLRVLDAPDDGPGILGQITRNPLVLPWRIFEAHRSVLRDPSVADCLVHEMWSPGSCTLAVLSGSSHTSGVVKPPSGMRLPWGPRR
jgi:hypothetical protein